MIVTRELLDCKMWFGFTPAMKLVYLSLWLRASAERECFPSVKKICDDSGLGRTTIIKSIKSLQMLSVIRKAKTRPFHSTLYQMQDISKMLGGGKE